MPRMRCGRGSAPDPAGGAHDALPGPLVGWGGGHPTPRTPPLGAEDPRAVAARCSAPRF